MPLSTNVRVRIQGSLKSDRRSPMGSKPPDGTSQPPRRIGRRPGDRLRLARGFVSRSRLVGPDLPPPRPPTRFGYVVPDAATPRGAPPALPDRFDRTTSDKAGSAQDCRR